MSDQGFQFTVKGLPIPQGSMRRSRQGVIIHANPDLDQWREAVGWQARAVLPGRWSKAGPFLVDALFNLPRPKSLPKTVTLPIAHKNDLDKLARAILDALSHIAYDDDGQVTDMNVRKRFGVPSATITIDRLMG